MPSASDRPAVEAIEALYDANRFFAAYELTADLWQRSELVPELSSRELLIASRLAFRLGNGKFARTLGREAWKREPDDPYVRYFAGLRYNPKLTLIDVLADFEANPELDTDDPTLQASWLSSQALYWSQVRDFERAARLLARAAEFDSDHAWVNSCRANMLLAADRWDEAETSAEAAFAAAPGMPAVANSLAAVLSRRGRVAEVAERLLTEAAKEQSFEIGMMAAWYACAAAERHWPDVEQWLPRADALADRLPDLAPLADRDAGQAIAQIRLDVALTRNDPESALARAREIPWPFARAVAKSLREQQGGKLHIQPHQPVYQKHDTCMPASMATLLRGMGEEVDEDEVATAITYGGTPTWKAVEWLRDHNWHVRQCLLTPERARELLRHNFPFVFLMEWDEGAHATAAIGYDAGADLMIVHDPSRTRWSRYVVERLGATEAPIGPEALVFCAEDRAAELDAVAPEEPLAVARRRFFRLMDRNGAKPALAKLPELVGDNLDHPIPQYLRAVGRATTGEARHGIDDLLQLFRDHPRCTAIRRSIVAALYQTGNTGYLRETLREITEAGRLPGSEDQQNWRYPPGRYLCQYADTLGLSADRFQEAERLVIQVIEREPANAVAWHVLGDLRFRRNDLPACELPYRIASYLATENPHYARACADLRHRLGDTDGAIAFMRRRAELLGTKTAAADAATALVDTLEAYGMPAAADEVFADACQRFPEAPELMHYAMHYCIRMGRWQQAEDWLRALEESDHRLLALSAATAFYELRSDWQRAHDWCRQWLDAAPEDMTARRALIRFVVNADGYAAAADLAQQWRDEHPDDETYEELLFDQLPIVGRSREVVPILEARLKRNPDDPWAWRELVLRLLAESEQLPADARAPIRQRLDAAMAACLRTCPDHEVTLLLRSKIAEADGDYEAAVDLGFASLRQEPAAGHAYRRIWFTMARLPKDRQKEIRARLEDSLLRVVGTVYPARELAQMIAGKDGLDAALASLDRWQSQRPDDPVLAETRADLLLDYGQGRSDAARAAELLAAASERFPTVAGLRQSLARAHNLLLDEDSEIAVCKDFLRRYPADVGMHLQLAELHRRRDELPAARDLIARAIAIAPRQTNPRDAMARFLWLTGDPEAAVTSLREAVAAIPESIGLLETLITCLFDLGRLDEAVATAHAAVDSNPENSGLWLNLARTLERSPRDTDFPAMERAYLQAIELDAGGFDAADELASHYVYRQQYQQAHAVLEPLLSELPDPTAVRGRLAWTARMEGRKEDAYRDMQKLLTESPWYVWGWGEYLDWLVEDEDWSTARDRLREWPAVLADNLELRSRRLMVLEDASARSDLIENEWLQLVADFPRSITVNVRRFDRLWAEERFSEAEETLAAIEGFHPAQGHLMARRAAVLARDKQFDQAFAKAEAVWFLPEADNAPPEHRTWQAFADADHADAVVDRIEGLLESHRLPGVTIFRLALDQIVRQNRQPFWPIKACEPSVKRVRRWQRLLDRLTDQETGDHRAATISSLTDLAAHKIAVNYWRQLPPERQQYVTVWQQAAHAMLGVDPGQARPMLAGWREFPGVEMFIVCNHVIACLRSTNDPAEIQASCLDALTGLNHDWTARYLATAAAHATLRLGQFDQFLAFWDQWHPYLTTDNADNRFYASVWVDEQLEFLPLCHQALTSDNPDAAWPALNAEAKQLLTRRNTLRWGLTTWPAIAAARAPQHQPGSLKRLLWRFLLRLRSNGTEP